MRSIKNVHNMFEEVLEEEQDYDSIMIRIEKRSHKPIHTSHKLSLGGAMSRKKLLPLPPNTRQVLPKK